MFVENHATSAKSHHNPQILGWE